MFRSQLFDHLLSCLVLLLLLCLFASFIWYVAVMLSMCVRAWMHLSVGCLVVNCSQPNLPQTSTSGMHTHRQHTATYQINNFTTQTSREGSNSTTHKRRPPEDGQTIVTETCRVLMMCFTFLTIQSFKCECVLKRVH